MTIEAKPTRFADVFSQTGGLPLPKRSPQRQAYRLMELSRWRDELDIPIILQPDNFPSNENPGYRLVAAAQLAGQNATRLSAEIGRSLWEHDQDIGEWNVLVEAAARAGMDAEAIRANGPGESELDAVIEQNVDEAIAAGVFGAPSFVFDDGEIMWGQDRVHFVAKKLANAV